MITEQQLFDRHWRRFGDEENDPFYKLILIRPVLGLYDLVGNIRASGIFEIYGAGRLFANTYELDLFFDVNAFVANKDMMSRYGSSKPL